MSSTLHIEHIQGLPITVPNKAIDREGFYISYNNYDTDLYGGDTTALVVGNMEHFYILKGNHLEKYLELNNLEECLNYFKDNIDQISRYSEKPK